MSQRGNVPLSGTYHSIKTSVVGGEVLDSSLVTLAVLVAWKHKPLELFTVKVKVGQRSVNKVTYSERETFRHKARV